MKSGAKTKKKGVVGTRVRRRGGGGGGGGTDSFCFQLLSSE
jgi:hypothetical protein